MHFTSRDNMISAAFHEKINSMVVQFGIKGHAIAAMKILSPNSSYGFQNVGYRVTAEI